MLDTLESLFKRCFNANYTHVNEDGDFAIQRDGDKVYLLFECTNSKTDWFHNFLFFEKPYKDMGITWRCHRGFLYVWKAIEPYIKSTVMDKSVKEFVVVGYSHGAAIATLAHEYVWFNRPDVREKGLVGYGFGCPRCYFGLFGVKKKLKERWINFHPVRNQNDLVTHVPPVALGFRHVNKVLKLPNKGVCDNYTKLKCINAHYPENYIFNCKEYDKLNNQ